MILSFKFQKERAVLLSARWIRWTFIADNDSKSFCQESISSMKWSPTGQILLTCAKEEAVKLWANPDSCSDTGSGWHCLQSLRHPSLVNGVAWCSLPGCSPKPLSMFAVYVDLECALCFGFCDFTSAVFVVSPHKMIILRKKSCYGSLCFSDAARMVWSLSGLFLKTFQTSQTPVPLIQKDGGRMKPNPS